MTRVTQVFVIGACAVVICNQAIIPLGKSIINGTAAYIKNKEAVKTSLEYKKRLEARGSICKQMLQERIHEIQKRSSGNYYLDRESAEYATSGFDVLFQRCIDSGEDF